MLKVPGHEQLAKLSLSLREAPNERVSGLGQNRGPVTHAIAGFRIRDGYVEITTLKQLGISYGERPNPVTFRLSGCLWKLSRSKMHSRISPNRVE